ncbi:MAG: MarR family transcriptional regulator, partial [Kangiellaceae bacterium]|nr:MarR family transcriptional regulator [Kangiellaceae bacterium]
EQGDDKKSLSAAKLSVLQMIKQYNPSTLKDLADRQKVALPTMSKLVDDLQKRSLVIRAQSKEDARQRWIVPTQKGIQQLKLAASESENFWNVKVSSLSDTQVKQLNQSLDCLLKVL